MMKLKVFPFDIGGRIGSIAERVEKEGNKLLAENPSLNIEHTAVIPTGSGLSLLLIFYSEEDKSKKEKK